ncbi:MAG: cob(I)yrinic acid a,c-diamide adenosyltransferase [Chloroherpetonaceae bacterium]|nr:cob(I)yrinic acid a,c-diamide adenosyltransferase [Chloroherpetonaceae bacterium]
MPSRIYTRTGDLGTTGLFGGQRVSKDDLRVEAYGTVDELNAMLGQARVAISDPEINALLLALQADLFHLGADLATPDDEDTQKGRVTVRRVAPERVQQMEQWIDRFEQELSPLTRFVLPGGSPAAAALHVARVVCRRAERRCVTLAQATEMEGHPINPEVIRYLNRLSDLLFVLARLANHRQGVPDVHWDPDAS